MSSGRNTTLLADFLVSLRRKLYGRYGHLDDHMLDDSIEDALLRHLSCPQRFEADRGASLHFYLELWARSYLDRRLRKLKRRRRHEEAVGVSTEVLEKFVSEKKTERSIYLQTEKSKREVENWREALDAIVARLHPDDRAKVELLRHGVSIEDWALHLGIEHLPLKEKRRKVYSERDGLKKKLKRLAQKLQGGGHPRMVILLTFDNLSLETATGGSNMKTWMGVLIVVAAIVGPPLGVTVLGQTGGSNSVTITSANPQPGAAGVQGIYSVATGYNFVSITVYVMPYGGAAGTGGSGTATANQGDFNATIDAPAGTYAALAMLTVTDGSGVSYYFFSDDFTPVTVPPGA